MLVDSFISAFVHTITYKACFLFNFLFLHCIYIITVHCFTSASVLQMRAILYNPTTLCAYTDLFCFQIAGSPVYFWCFLAPVVMICMKIAYIVEPGQMNRVWSWASVLHTNDGVSGPGCLTCGGNILMEVFLWDASVNWRGFGAWLPYLWREHSDGGVPVRCLRQLMGFQSLAALPVAGTFWWRSPCEMPQTTDGVSRPGCLTCGGNILMEESPWDISEACLARVASFFISASSLLDVTDSTS